MLRASRGIEAARMYHMITVGFNADLLRQLDDLRRIYPDANRKEIIANLIRDAHASVGGWGKRAENDNAAFESATPVLR